MMMNRIQNNNNVEIKINNAHSQTAKYGFVSCLHTKFNKIKGTKNPE